MIKFLPAVALLILANAPASAQEPEKAEKAEKEDKTVKRAGEIVTQPVRDVGLEKTKIPEVLLQSVEQPYAPAGRGCAAVVAQIAELNEVLGPDFDADSKGNENKFGNLAAAGGEAVVNSLIPFRGLVREVTGAAGAQRRLDSAISAGVARRGYLRGIAVSRGCKLPPPPAPSSEAPAEG